MKKLMLLPTLLLLVSCYKVEVVTEKAIVVSKNYYPSTSSMSSGVGLTSNGQMIVTTTASGEDEKYIVVFKNSKNNLIPIEDKNLFSDCSVNEIMSITYKASFNSDGTFRQVESNN